MPDEFGSGSFGDYQDIINSGRFDSYEDFINNRPGRDPITDYIDNLNNRGGNSLTPYPDKPIDFINPFEKNIMERVKNEKMKMLDIPFKVFDATIETNNPIIIGDYCFWPTKHNSVAFVCLRVPRIKDFNLTIKKEVVGNTIKVTSGTISYSASVVVSVTDIQNNMYSWLRELKERGHSAVDWSFEPLYIAKERHSLILPQEHEYQYLLSLDNINEITLSENDALTWMKMLETNQGNKIPGIHQVTITFRKGYMNFFGSGIDLPKLPSFENGYLELSIPASILLSNFGAESITIINPKIENETKVLVSSNPIVEYVIVTISSNDGKAISHTFTSDGGIFPHKWTTDEMSSLEIRWEAIIKYRPKGWPEVKETGKLSANDNNLIVMIKPESWIREHSLTVFLMDEQGNVLPTETAKVYQIYAEFIYKGSFLQGDGILRSTFQCEPHKTLDVAFPQPPTNGTGNLELRISVFNNENKNHQIYTLKEDDYFVIAKIFEDKRIQIETNKI